MIYRSQFAYSQLMKTIKSFRCSGSTTIEHNCIAHSYTACVRQMFGCRLIRWKTIWNDIRCGVCCLDHQRQLLTCRPYEFTGMCHFCLITPIRTKWISFVWNFVLLFRRCYHPNNNKITVSQKKNTNYSCSQRVHVMFARRCRFIPFILFFAAFIVGAGFFLYFSLELTRSKHSFKWIYW